MKSNVTREGSRVAVSPVTPYEVMDPMFESVRVALTTLGESLPVALVQGISGAAFRMAGICPCAPTCCVAMDVTGLLDVLGYHCEAIPVVKDDADRQRDLIQRVRGQVDSGHPALVWQAFTFCEWDVVAGYDADKQTFLGRGTYASPTGPLAEQPWDRPGSADIALGAVLITRKRRPFDMRKAFDASITEAIRHGYARAKPDGEKWVLMEGIACYERWIQDLRDRRSTPGNGDAYCLQVYGSCRRFASAYLRMAPSTGYRRACLDRAGVCFDREARYLNRLSRYLGWQAPRLSTGVREAVVRDLQVAAKAYADGMQWLRDSRTV